MIVGVGGGFFSIILSTPMYRTKLLMEVQTANRSLPKGSAYEGGPPEDNEVNIQTQIGIMRSGSFLKRGADRMQSESVPLVPTGHDIFSRLRQRIRPTTQDPSLLFRAGLNVAITTFDARPVNHTRLIELSCESTSPDVAAEANTDNYVCYDG